MLTGFFCRGFHQFGRHWSLHLFMYSIKVLPLGFTGLRVQLSFSAQKGTRDSSKSSFEEFLSCLLCYHIGELKFFTFGVFLFVSLSTFLFPGRLGLFIKAITSLLVSVAGIKTKQNKLPNSVLVL